MPPQSFSLSQKLSAFFNLLCNRLVRKKAGSHGQRLSERAYSLILPSCSSQGLSCRGCSFAICGFCCVIISANLWPTLSLGLSGSRCSTHSACALFRIATLPLPPLRTSLSECSIPEGPYSSHPCGIRIASSG